jgi:hypothetical protein
MELKKRQKRTKFVIVHLIYPQDKETDCEMSIQVLGRLNTCEQEQFNRISYSLGDILQGYPFCTPYTHQRNTVVSNLASKFSAA